MNIHIIKGFVDEVAKSAAVNPSRFIKNLKQGKKTMMKADTVSASEISLPKGRLPGEANPAMGTGKRL